MPFGKMSGIVPGIEAPGKSDFCRSRRRFALHQACNEMQCASAAAISAYSTEASSCGGLSHRSARAVRWVSVF